MTRTLDELGAFMEYESDATHVATDGLSLAHIATTLRQAWSARKRYR